MHTKNITHKIALVVQVLLLFISLNIFAAKNNITESEARTWVSQSQQLGFQENKGQMLGSNNKPVPFVLFKAEAPKLNIWVTTTGLTYQFFTIDKKYLTNDDGTPKIGFDGNQEKEKSVRWHRVDMVLKGANIQKENIQTIGDITQGNVNYYLGHCPDGIFDVKTYSKLIMKEVYPGIDWVLYTSKEGRLKHEFIVHLGANPKLIKLVYEGSGNIDINDNQLHFSNELGNLTESDLLCYQGDENNIITSSYRAIKNNSLTYFGAGNNHSKSETLNSKQATLNSKLFSYEVDINIENYDKSQDLVIDPELVWGTLYGGNGQDGFLSMATDTNGSLFITGYTNSTTFPTQDIGAFFQETLAGIQNNFILKFDNFGDLLWATYYGGTGVDQGLSIATNLFGNVWITGWTTSTDFPTQDTGTFFQGTFAGVFDVFILKFDNAGNRIWATYYGGSGKESGRSIATDLFGNVWITGVTSPSADFPTQDTGTFFQGGHAGANDIFILKFDNAGNRIWATYYGGSGNEAGHSIATDLFGNVWITGKTRSDTFPTYDAGGGTFFQDTMVGDDDVFILKFDSAGNRLWATYYGGSGDDEGNSITTDPLGNLWVAGLTKSVDFPTQDTGTFFQGTFAGGTGSYPFDIFLLKFDNLGNRLWGTYYGGSGDERVRIDAIIISDNCGNIYVSFETTSSDIFTLNSGNCHYYDSVFGGGSSTYFDAFITKFDNNANLLWASYIGGDNSDFYAPLAIDNNNNLFIGGEFTQYSNSSTLPIQDPGGGAYFDNTPNGGDDSYILKFSAPIVATTKSQHNATICSPCNGSATVNVTCGLPPYSFVWSNGSQSIDTFNASNTVTVLCAGDYNVIITSNCNQTDTLYFIITGNPLPSSTNTASICNGDSILLGGSFQTTAGVYNDTLFGGNFMGCDSVISTTLVINNLSISYQTITACDSVVLNNRVYTSNQVVSDTLLGLAFNGCDSIIETTIDLLNKPNAIVNSDTTICENSTVMLQADGGDTYIWLPGASLNDSTIPNPIATPSLDTKYLLLATNGCGTDTASVTIQTINCELFIPNVFSPNGDGDNDVFMIRGDGIENILIKIYDRWGNRVFATDNINVGWNGKKGGEEVGLGVYVYYLDFTLLDGSQDVRKGNITLVR